MSTKCIVFIKVKRKSRYNCLSDAMEMLEQLGYYDVIYDDVLNRIVATIESDNPGLAEEFDLIVDWIREID